MTQEERNARIKELEKEIKQLRAEEQDIHNDPAKFEDERLRILGEAAEKVRNLTKEGDKFTMFISATSSNDKQAVIAGSGSLLDLAACISLGIKELGEELRLTVTTLLKYLPTNPFR